MQWVSWIADAIGILGGIFALFAWLQSRKVSSALEAEKQRKDKKVRIILSYSGDKLELPVELRRGEFTRAEILGRLGMIPMNEKGKRFELRYLNTPEFLRRINEISDGNQESVLTIPCSKEEFSQFSI